MYRISSKPEIRNRNWQSICLLLLKIALAQLLVMNLTAQEVTSANDLIEQLTAEIEPKIQTRGITVNVASTDQGRVSFNSIQFEYDSARLSQASSAQLDELGKALVDNRLIDESFAIEGHTDAHGSDQYNESLSLRRAAAVKEYLAEYGGIADHRLQVVGKGEDEPRTADPYSPENRRVDIVNLKNYQ